LRANSWVLRRWVATRARSSTTLSWASSVTGSAAVGEAGEDGGGEAFGRGEILGLHVDAALEGAPTVAEALGELAEVGGEVFVADAGQHVVEQRGLDPTALDETGHHGDEAAAELRGVGGNVGEEVALAGAPQQVGVEGGEGGVFEIVDEAGGYGGQLGRNPRSLRPKVRNSRQGLYRGAGEVEGAAVEGGRGEALQGGLQRVEGRSGAGEVDGRCGGGGVVSLRRGWSSSGAPSGEYGKNVLGRML
jgi:hypothetical protein